MNNPLSPFLSAAQIATLGAVFNRLIPADEFLGAWENGVGDYLAGQFARDLSNAIEFYGTGLDALNNESQARYQNDFADLNEATQDELLAAIEKGETQTAWPMKANLFFEATLNHSAEGYYADPGNSGNKSKISWQMIGFLDR